MSYYRTVRNALKRFVRDYSYRDLYRPTPPSRKLARTSEARATQQDLLSQQLSGNGRDQGAARTHSARRPTPPSAPRSTWPAPRPTPRSWLPLRSGPPARRAPRGPPRRRACLLTRALSTPAARLWPADRLAVPAALRPAPAHHPAHHPWGPLSVSGRQRKKPAPDFTSGAGYRCVTNGGAAR